MPRFRPFAILLLFAVVASLRGQEPPSNVVLVFFDDLGYGDLEPFGGSVAMPVMQRLAREGVRATAFYVAQPVCSASRAALLTGRYPHRVGVTGALFPDARVGLPREETTLAELLHARGYATGAFGKWHLGDRPEYHPFRHGFDAWFGVPYSHDMTTRDPAKRFRFTPLPLLDGETTIEVEPDPATLTSAITGRAVAFVRQHAARPFFLYLPHPMPHVPIAASKEFAGTSGQGLYADVLRELDASVGAVVSELERLSVLDRTLIIVTSDNGPWAPFGNHAGSSGGLREAKGTAFEGGIRVPFLARLPGRIPAGRVVSAPFATIDLLPTIAALADIPAPRQPIDGRDVSALLTGRGDAAPDRALVFRYEGDRIHAVREGRWKLHLPHSYPSSEAGTPGRDGERGVTVQREIGPALFDLEADPGERDEVADRHPEIVRRLQAVAEADLARDQEVRRAPRRWLGPEWCANRLQDWSRRGEWLLAESAGLPFRTALREDLRLLPSPPLPGGSVTFEVEIAPAADDALGDDAAAGILIGAGDAQNDPRRSSLVHQAPGVDGGLLVLVDRRGALRILDFSVAPPTRSLWSLPATATLASLPSLAPVSPETLGGAWTAATPLRLRVVVTRAGDDTVDLGATVTAGERLVAGRRLSNLPRGAVDGTFGLVAHRGSKAGFGFRDFRITASETGWLDANPTRAFGPILGILYTLSNFRPDTLSLRLAVHLPPGAASEIGPVALEVAGEDGGFRALAEAVPDSRTNVALFAVSGLEAKTARRYRVRGSWRDPEGLERPFAEEGALRLPGVHGDRTVIGLGSCVKHLTVGGAWNPSGVWYPHEDLVRNLAAQDPDLLVFAGDQLYEGDITSADRAQPSLDYLMRWHRFLRSFGALTRDRPTIVTPDDHDVYHGNLWGAGGLRAAARDGLSAQDGGGYVMSPDFVALVHATQTGHLPPPLVPGPVGDGMPPFTTRLVYAGLDFAILSDRMWKSAPAVTVPEGRVRNGFFEARDFDPKASDREGAALLGTEQEAFLAAWADDPRPDAPARFVLSQSPFVAVQTLPAGANDSVVPSLGVLEPGAWAENDVPSADCDTNGWPKAARDRAVRLIARAGALHLAGDQHLATLVQYGLDGFRDGPFVFTGPALSNAWPRRWMPKTPGGGREPEAAPGTGDFVDAFGNRMTVRAVVNPRVTGLVPAALHDLVPGYGIVRVARSGTDIDVEAWPRSADPGRGGRPYAGFPVRVR